MVDERAVVSSFSYMSVTRYPCVDKGAMFQAYRGHSSHVTKVRFTNDHRFLISLGGNDKSIIQWRHDVEDLDSNSSEGEEEDMEEIKDIVHINAHKVDRSPLEVRTSQHFSLILDEVAYDQ